MRAGQNGPGVRAIVAFVLAIGVAAGCTRESTESARDGAKKVAEQAERRLEQAAAVFDDATVTAKVKTALIAEPRLKGFAIDVDTSQNVVTLSGTVPTDEARTTAERIARETGGVKEVKNELQVKPS